MKALQYIFVACLIWGITPWKAYAKDIYVDPIAEVYTARESDAAVLYHINNARKTIYYNWKVTDELENAFIFAKRRRLVEVEKKPSRNDNYIIIDGYIVIVRATSKVLILESSSLAALYLDN